jgi:hypothetical protein
VVALVRDAGAYYTTDRTLAVLGMAVRRSFNRSGECQLSAKVFETLKAAVIERPQSATV